MGICIGPSRRTEMRWCWRTVPDRMRNHPCWFLLLGRSLKWDLPCCVLICHSGKRVRMDLHFRRWPSKDRRGIRRAAEFMRRSVQGRVFLGGHSYGGRQATMLAAEEPDLASGLLLLSYPLHPPRKPEQKRDAHFPKLQTESLFVHGSRDPFGSPEEMEQALKLIPARTELVIREGAGHDLKGTGLEKIVVEKFVEFFGGG